VDRPGRQLNVGETLVVTIRARDLWNATGVQVEPRDRYRLAASGGWTDFFIRTDADGYATDEAPAPVRGFLRRFEPLRRAPDARWFALMGCVSESGAPFRIGTGTTWANRSAERGPLLCFANDVPSAYWNNLGAVRLTIERLA
jgi:hypothetical protein